MRELTRDQKIAAYGLCVAVSGTIAALVVVPEVRNWSCANGELLCYEDDKERKELERLRLQAAEQALEAKIERERRDRIADERWVVEREERANRARLEEARANEALEFLRNEKERLAQAATVKVRPVTRTASARKPAGLYAATSYCSATGARGRSAGQATPALAMSSAVADCVRLGGIPQCCEHGTMLGGSPPVYSAPASYSARSYCSLTNASGISRGQPTPQQAFQAAILSCIGNGGIPQCCQNGAQLMP